MEDNFNQLTPPDRAWEAFLLEVIEPTCDRNGWRVEYGEVSDGFCIIFADTGPTTSLSFVEEGQQLRLIPDEPDPNQYYRE